MLHKFLILGKLAEESVPLVWEGGGFDAKAPVASIGIAVVIESGVIVSADGFSPPGIEVGSIFVRSKYLVDGITSGGAVVSIVVEVEAVCCDAELSTAVAKSIRPLFVVIRSSLSVLSFDALTVPAGTDDDELLKKL